MGLLSGIGSFIRSSREGKMAAEAAVICSRLTGLPISEFKGPAMGNSYVCGSKEELALFLLVPYCEGQKSLRGEVIHEADPNVRGRIVGFYKECKANGLIDSQYIEQNYSSL